MVIRDHDSAPDKRQLAKHPATLSHTLRGRFFRNTRRMSLDLPANALGIDAKNLEGKLDKAAWDKLFTDVTPADLAKNAKPFPIAPYFNDILEGYEKKVSN